MVYSLIVAVYWSVFLDHSVFACELDFCALSLWARKTATTLCPHGALSGAGYELSTSLHSHNSVLYYVWIRIKFIPDCVLGKVLLFAGLFGTLLASCSQDDSDRLAQVTLSSIGSMVQDLHQVGSTSMVRVSLLIVVRRAQALSLMQRVKLTPPQTKASWRLISASSLRSLSSNLA